MAQKAQAVKVYCALEFRQVLDKSVVVLNFGDYLTPLTDAEGKQIAFANRVGALNYMTKEGWTLEPIETLDGVHKVLVMSKEVKSEAEIRQRFPMGQEVKGSP